MRHSVVQAASALLFALRSAPQRPTILPFAINLSIEKMRLPLRTRILGCFLLVLFLASVPAWCMDKWNPTKLPSFVIEPRSRRSFAEYYKFPSSQVYDLNSNLAGKQLGIEQYYDANQDELILSGREYLDKEGATASIDSLRSHPNFVDFYDGKSYTPSAYIRIADLLPNNPLGSKNPDVVIFMPQIRLKQQTVLLSLLYPKAIIRGVSDQTSRGRAYQVVWENLRRPGRTEWWLNDLSEVFKWPILDNLERLGYNPTTIDREIAAYENARPAESYATYTSVDIERILKSTGRYLKQFDKASGNEKFNSYSLVFTPLDHSKESVPWIQAPMFRYEDTVGRIVLDKYMFDREEFPVLDRIRYNVGNTGVSEGTTLIPEAIVRPVRITPTIEFQTIYVFPSKYQNFGIVNLAHIKASMERLVPHFDIEQEALSRSVRRPSHHPLHFIQDRHLFLLKDAIKTWRKFEHPSKVAREQRDSGKEATPRSNKASVASLEQTLRVSSNAPTSRSDVASVGSTTAAQKGSSKLATLRSDSDRVDSSSQEKNTHRTLAAFKNSDAPVRPDEQEQRTSRVPVTTRANTAPIEPVARDERIRIKLEGPDSKNPALSDLHPFQDEHDKAMPKTPRIPFKIPLSPVPESPMLETPRLLPFEGPSPSEHLRDESTRIRAEQLKSSPAADADQVSHSPEKQPLSLLPNTEQTVDEASSRQEDMSPVPRFSTKRRRTRLTALVQTDGLQGHQVGEPSARENEVLRSHLKQEAGTPSAQEDKNINFHLNGEAAATSARADKDVGSQSGKQARPWTVQQYRPKPGPWPVSISRYLQSEENPYKRPRRNALDALQDHLDPALDDAFGRVKAHPPWKYLRP